MTYQRQDCVVIVTGRAWAEDNGRTYGDPEDVGENAVAYINVQRASNSLVFVIGKRRLYWVRNTDIEPFDPVETGDEYDTKVCLTCGLLKPTEDFEFNQKATGGGTRVRRPRCRPCFSNGTADGVMPRKSSRCILGPNMDRSKAICGSVRCARSTASLALTSKS